MNLIRTTIYFVCFCNKGDGQQRSLASRYCCSIASQTAPGCQRDGTRRAGGARGEDVGLSAESEAQSIEISMRFLSSPLFECRIFYYSNFKYEFVECFR